MQARVIRGRDMFELLCGTWEQCDNKKSPYFPVVSLSSTQASSHSGLLTPVYCFACSALQSREILSETLRPSFHSTSMGSKMPWKQRMRPAQNACTLFSETRSMWVAMVVGVATHCSHHSLFRGAPRVPHTYSHAHVFLALVFSDHLPKWNGPLPIFCTTNPTSTGAPG